MSFILSHMVLSPRGTREFSCVQLFGAEKNHELVLSNQKANQLSLGYYLSFVRLFGAALLRQRCYRWIEIFSRKYLYLNTFIDNIDHTLPLHSNNHTQTRRYCIN